MAQQPLELILARNLIATVSLSAFIVDGDGVLVFFNESAGDLIGRRFEEVGRLPREEWSSEFGPFDEFGQLIPTNGLPLTRALREGLPANGRFHVRRGGDGRAGEPELLEVEVSALPLVGADGFKGAVIAFWPAAPDAGG
jgi:PAS domain-containing protein